MSSPNSVLPTPNSGNGNANLSSVVFHFVIVPNKMLFSPSLRTRIVGCQSSSSLLLSTSLSELSAWPTPGAAAGYGVTPALCSRPPALGCALGTGVCCLSPASIGSGGGGIDGGWGALSSSSSSTADERAGAGGAGADTAAVAAAAATTAAVVPWVFLTAFGVP